MWLDLSNAGMKIVQSTNMGEPEGVVIFARDTNATKPAAANLIKCGFKPMGMTTVGGDNGVCGVYHSSAIKFKLSDLESWVVGFDKSMIKKDAPVEYMDITDIMERIAIHEEGGLLLGETFSDDIPFNYEL